MSAGASWVDEIMVPLRPLVRNVSAYNRIYEAVFRGTEVEGRALVNAIRDSILAARSALPSTPAPGAK